MIDWVHSLALVQCGLFFWDQKKKHSFWDQKKPVPVLASACTSLRVLLRLVAYRSRRDRAHFPLPQTRTRTQTLSPPHTQRTMAATTAPKSEPTLTYLMPVYAAASWYGLVRSSRGGGGAITYDGGHLLPTSAFGVAWAAHNWRRRGFVDLGFFTMGLVLAGSAWERHRRDRGEDGGAAAVAAETLGCSLASANFALVLAGWRRVAKAARRGGKSELWLRTFGGYCAVMAAFWAVAAFRNHRRGKGEGAD